MQFLPSRKAVEVLGISANTLRALETNGDIEVIWISGQRKYNVKKFVEENNTKKVVKHKIIYCRVSSRKQTADLKRQVSFLTELYPDYEVIQEVASGINDERKGLQTILEYAMRRELAEVVVTYKDRLARFGFNIIKNVIELSGAKLLVHHETELSPDEELASDLISIITVYGARIHGSRRYKLVANKIIPKTSNDDKGSSEKESNTSDQPKTNS
jgi:predicted site-specific integrase-resolvase